MRLPNHCLVRFHLDWLAYFGYAVQPDEIMARPCQGGPSRANCRGELRLHWCARTVVDDSEAPLARDFASWSGAIRGGDKRQPR